jgi:DNA-directed RNA polymerase subunit RPC12/RpoP
MSAQTETRSDRITCPDCGWKCEDSYLYFSASEADQPREIECERCESKLSVQQIITIDYKTKVIK